MKSLEQKTCSNCARSFNCGSESREERCWCDRLPHLSLVAINDRDCFCPECLSEVIRKQTGETTMTCSLAEGVDFYWEGGRMVFTANFHLRRGYCCASGCRHCPYEEAKSAS